jgi:hypothetical protein
MGEVNNIVAGGASITVGSDLGFIKHGAGVVLTPSCEPLYIKVEGVNTCVAARLPDVSYEISTVLSEPTMANIKLAWSWKNASSTASGSSLAFGGENFVPPISGVTIYGYVPGSGGYTRQIVIDRAMAIPGGELKYTNAEETCIALTMRCIYDSTNSRIGRLVDATS